MARGTCRRLDGCRPRRRLQCTASSDSTRHPAPSHHDRLTEVDLLLLHLLPPTPGVGLLHRLLADADEVGDALTAVPRWLRIGAGPRPHVDMVLDLVREVLRGPFGSIAHLFAPEEPLCPRLITA